MYNMDKEDNLIQLEEEMFGEQINSVFENTFSWLGEAPRGSGARRGAAGWLISDSTTWGTCGPLG